MARKLITPEDIENHNKEGGAWGVIHGKVYDLQALANKAPCGREALLAYTGQDATKAFETVKHSDFAHEMAQQFLKGTYSEVRTKKRQNNTLIILLKAGSQYDTAQCVA